jgi:hypothetical protein
VYSLSEHLSAEANLGTSQNEIKKNGHVRTQADFYEVEVIAKGGQFASVQSEVLERKIHSPESDLVSLVSRYSLHLHIHHHSIETVTPQQFKPTSE